MVRLFLRTSEEKAFQLRKHQTQSAANDQYIAACIARVDQIEETSGSPYIKRFVETALSLKRSIFFVSAHWGNYFRSFTLIAYSMPEESAFIAFRGDPWEGEERLFAALESVSARKVSIYRAYERQGFLDVCRALHNGAHAFILFDVIGRPVRTLQCNFLGSSVGFASGWAELAHLTNSIVVLFEPGSIDRKETSFACVLDPTGTKRNEFAAACMGKASRMLENQIREEPSYWFMWEDLRKRVIDE